MLRISGDEDRTTQGRRRHALSRAFRVKSDLVVDLSGLHFADASVMVDLALLARRLQWKGVCVHLRGAQPQIRMLIELVGLHRLPGVRCEGGFAPA